MGFRMGINYFILFIKEKSMILKKKKLRKKIKLVINFKRRISYKFSKNEGFYRENLYMFYYDEYCVYVIYW